MTRDPPAAMVTLVGKTHLCGRLGSSLKLRPDRSTRLVEGLKSSTQSERRPALLVMDWFLASISLRTTEAAPELTMILVTELIAVRDMPNTSSLLVPPPQHVTWCTSTSMMLSPMTRLSVGK